MNAWGSNTDRILLLLAEEPMTKAEICRKLELTHNQVSSRISALLKPSKKFKKRIHICGYTRHAVSLKTYIRPMFALGDKPDKKRNIQPYTKKERSAMSYAKHLAKRNSSVFRQTLTTRQIYGI
jgi:DNA-binding transcriptional regulator GbsR (MarR family)